jgi:hypothetical protein
MPRAPWLILSCLWTTLLFGQGSTTPKPSSEFDRIQQLENEWLQGERTTDLSVFQRVLAEDYVNVTPQGIGPSKAEIIQHLKPHSGQAPPYTLETRDMRIYILGDVAVAAFTKTYIAKENAKRLDEDTTHIFQKNEGLWKLKISRASIGQRD